MAETKYLDENGVRHLIGKVQELHESGVTAIRVNGGEEQHGVVDIPCEYNYIFGDTEVSPIPANDIVALFE
ncbi:hypothetical protein [Muribaculum intestinale]|uniref:hypothetical protein n=1 Tax=Muribaculum intestinale TaxID=1796646 RepID=UPI0025A96F91|nr:hypothetical protein [Muribaculum intestinale]